MRDGRYVSDHQQVFAVCRQRWHTHVSIQRTRRTHNTSGSSFTFNNPHTLPFQSAAAPAAYISKVATELLKHSKRDQRKDGESAEALHAMQAVAPALELDQGRCRQTQAQ